VNESGAGKFGQQERIRPPRAKFGVNLSSQRCSTKSEETFLADRHKHLRAIVNQDGAVILDAESGTVSTLNWTGAIVWQRLERGESVAAIASDLARMTGEPIEATREDVVTFVDALRAQDLLPS
jgi:hypothetical protein